MPTVFYWALTALCGVAVAALLSRDSRRLREELDRLARAAQGPQPQQAPIRTLVRDPKTGIYRPK